MRLTEKQLKGIIKGAYMIVREEDGYLSFSHFSREQLDYLAFSDFFRARAVFSSSVTVEFRTDAEELGFSYKILRYGSKDTVEVYADGKKVAERRVEDVPQEGELSFRLPAGRKNVEVYFPCDLQFSVKDFYIGGKWRRRRVKRQKALFIGDSITQGFGSFSSGTTYANVVKRAMKYEILNQGMGGYRYDPKILTPMAGYTPDKIVVALGVNGHANPDREAWIQEFYENLHGLYGNIPTLVVTPLWSNHADIVESELIKTAEYIRFYAGKYPNVTLLDGFSLLPHEERYFCDKLHPNAEGMELYGKNLVKEMKKIVF